MHREPYDDAPLEDRDAVLGQAWRAVYTSVSGVDGGRREVSGAFFVPRGAPPENGWPVISLAHGTTGIGNDCGPSRQPDLMGYAPMVQWLLADKYAVALTDYEGLGESGSHPYLEPRTAAFNTIDAVRAMRAISPLVSARWMAVGYSQGGQAVWAADELNAYYGNDLQLQGSVALAPAANVTGRGRPCLVGFVDRLSTVAISAGHCRLRSIQPGSRPRLVSARVGRVFPSAPEPLRANRQSRINRPST